MVRIPQDPRGNLPAGCHEPLKTVALKYDRTRPFYPGLDINSPGPPPITELGSALQDLASRSAPQSSSLCRLPNILLLAGCQKVLVVLTLRRRWVLPTDGPRNHTCHLPQSGTNDDSCAHSHYRA